MQSLEKVRTGRNHRKPSAEGTSERVATGSYVLRRWLQWGLLSPKARDPWKCCDISGT